MENVNINNTLVMKNMVAWQLVDNLSSCNFVNAYSAKFIFFLRCGCSYSSVKVYGSYVNVSSINSMGDFNRLDNE